MGTKTASNSESDVRQYKGAESLLHKMRNVLNSVHVSAGLINDQLRNFHVEDIGRVADMLEAHHTDLGWYLTQDQKGKKIPHFLGQLSQEFTYKHMAALSELTALNYQLEQLESLLTAGQGPVGKEGFKDTIHFSQIMDDLIAKHQNELDDMHVKVIREYQPSGEGILELAKLLTILEDLIRNSILAMRKAPDRSHRLTFHVLPCLDREKFIRLQIEDTGVGIPTDGLTQVFAPQSHDASQGAFLPDLHSSAVSAKDLGGSLRVWSDGPSQGAIFTLDLPVIHMEGTR